VTKSQSSINVRTITKIVSEYSRLAADLIRNKKKVHQILEHAFQKTGQMNNTDNSKGPLENVWDGFLLAMNVAKDWISGRYRQIPVATITTVIAGIVYFLSPADLIPDFIPFAGFLDDASVIGLIFAQINADLIKYKVWKAKNG
jgi:uncharacterized membrane protein YkvA (DUF1232 family)